MWKWPYAKFDMYTVHDLIDNVAKSVLTKRCHLERANMLQILVKNFDIHSLQTHLGRGGQ